MNILVIGKPYESLIELIRQSKLLDKLFIATDEQVEDIPNIKYYSLENLAEKARALQVDIAFNTDKNLIQEGLVEIFKENRL